MRLFIAIELSDEAREHLAQVQQALKAKLAGASFTKVENLHLTLKFLGEVEDRKVAAIGESLGKVRASAPIELAAERIECFPNRGPVRIVAAGIGGQVSALVGVHEAVEQRCRFLGFERESRQYRPHVTLARAKNSLPAGARPEAEEATQNFWPGPRFVVTELVLIRSILKPTGSQYVPVARFPLR